MYTCIQSCILGPCEKEVIIASGFGLTGWVSKATVGNAVMLRDSIWQNVNSFLWMGGLWNSYFFVLQSYQNNVYLSIKEAISETCLVLDYTWVLPIAGPGEKYGRAGDQRVSAQVIKVISEHTELALESWPPRKSVWRPCSVFPWRWFQLPA